jgi:hypothetical protein
MEEKILINNCYFMQYNDIKSIPKAFFIFVIVILFSLTTNAQHTAHLLKEPADWEFESFPLPPSFAPAITYKGVEELRFAPGMFNKNAADYFTYAFVAQLDDITTVSKNDIHHYLLNYYRGLCAMTAKDRKLTVDTSKVAVQIEKKKGTAANDIIYNAVLNVFGVFADGAPVKLNMEIKVVTNNAAKKTWLVFITSPLEKTNDIWKKLYQIRERVTVPVSGTE